jgi:hypothetical protein
MANPPPGFFMHPSHGLMPISSSPNLFTRFPDPGPVTMYGSGREHRAFQPSPWRPPENWDMLPDSDTETGDFTNQFFTSQTQPAPTQEVLGPPPPVAPHLLEQEVSGEQLSTVPIDPTNMIPQLFSDVSAPADQLDAYEEYGLSPTDYKSPPGSGYLYSHPVLKAEAQMPFSELGVLNREGADWQKKVGPAMTVLGGSQIPGASLLGLFAAGLNKLGAYHQFNPATDSNLFADPETGRATWGTTGPGGSGSQRGTLNLYNMLQDYGGSYPSRQVQTPSRGKIPQYANARDLAYIMGQGDRPPPGLYTQQTPVGYQDFGEGHNVTNQEALNTYNRTGAGALLNEAGAILGPDAGYNETSALAASMAEDLQGQMDYGDWGSWY